MLDFSLECCIPTSTKTHNIMTTTESHILVDFGTILENCVIAVALLLTGITLRYGFIYYKRMRRMMAMLNSFNQVPTKPIIGSIHLFTGNMRERFRKMVALSKQYEFPFVAWLMNVPIVFIGKCDDIQIVLNKSNDRDLQGVFEKIFCEGLIGLHGEQWRKSRRITISAFTPIMLSRYFSVFDEYAALLTKKLEKLCDTDEVLNIANYVFTIHLSSTVRNLAGYEIEPWSNESKQFVDAMTKCFQMEIKRFANPLLFFNVLYEIYLFITGNRKMYEIIHQLPRKILQDRLAKYSMKGAPQYDGTSPSTNVSNSKLLIDSVLQRHATDVNFKEKNICDELLNLMIGGFESTGLVTSFMLLMLAMHQEAQEKVYHEIKTIYAHDGQEVQMEDLKKLVYMEQCINETLRKFPFIATDTRIHDEDIVLNNDRVIPAGCQIFLQFYDCHHDKEFFPNADNWDPEHFAPERKNIYKQAFFPFAGGLRSCVGSRYSMMSLKIQFVHLLRRYRFSTEMKMQDIHLISDLAVRNDTGYWLKIHSRQKN